MLRQCQGRMLHCIESSSSSPSNRLAICDRSEWLKSGPDIADWAYSCHHHHSCSTFISIISNIIIKHIVILNNIPHHHVPLYHHHINIALLTRHVFSQWGEHKERTIIKIISISDIIIMIREDLNRKKNVFFRALPESPKPSPLTSIRATWSFFWTSKTTFCA